MLAEIPGQRITQNRFDGSIRFIGMIVLAAAGGIPQIDPIGRPVAGSLETLFVHKGLQIMDRVKISPLPIPTDKLGHPA
jgi:hypothetical protein